MKQATRDKLLQVGAKPVIAALAQRGLKDRAVARLPLSEPFAGTWSRSSTHSTGRAEPLGPTPTSAVRATRGCVLNTASQGIVYGVPCGVTTRRLRRTVTRPRPRSRRLRPPA